MKILNMRPSPQSAQLRRGLQWEALKYQGGCYRRAAGVWALRKSNFGNQWKPRVTGKPRCAGRQRQRAQAQSRCEVALNCRRVGAFCRGRSHAQCLETTKTDAQPSVASTWYLCAPTFEVSRPRRAQPGARRLDRRVGAHVFHGPLIAHRLEDAASWDTYDDSDVWPRRKELLEQ